MCRFNGISGMTNHKDNKKLAILQALGASGRSLRSAEIGKAIATRGYQLSDRTIRLYLKELDKEGLTENLGRQGRLITEKGTLEVSGAGTLARVGFLSAKIDQMTYRMGFDLACRRGTVVVNTTFVDPETLAQCLDPVCRVFEKGFAMGQLAGLLGPGETIGNTRVPEGMVGFCTVCSITLNGVLLKHGIPTHSRFGGLVGIRDGRPTRFLEMIMYDGTSIDPLEIFIRGAMTDYLGAITTGSGSIGASFREVPAESLGLVEALADKLDAVGLGGFMAIGQPNQDLFDIPVSDGRAGAVVIGGLNPVATLEESGFRVVSRALAGLLEFNQLCHYEELNTRLAQFRS